jgi:hypothetical protein
LEVDAESGCEWVDQDFRGKTILAWEMKAVKAKAKGWWEDCAALD